MLRPTLSLWNCLGDAGRRRELRKVVTKYCDIVPCEWADSRCLVAHVHSQIDAVLQRQDVHQLPLGGGGAYAEMTSPEHHLLAPRPEPAAARREAQARLQGRGGAGWPGRSARDRRRRN